MNILRSLALLFAGALIGILGALITPFLNIYSIVACIVVIILLLLFGSGITSEILYKYNAFRRERTLKIGILKDMGWDLENEQIYTWTNISPEEWKEAIERCARNNNIKVKVRLIESKENFDPYTAILNPYGGVYPERDLVNLVTLSKIFNNVKRKGIFVNVADIPGYFAYSSLLGRRIDTSLRGAPFIYEEQTFDGRTFQIPLRRLPLFELTPFTEKLGLTIYKSEEWPIFNWGVLEFEEGFENIFDAGISNVDVHRVALFEKDRNVEFIIKPRELTLVPIGKVKVTPFFSVKYGDGDFLILLIFGNAQEERVQNELKEMLTKALLIKINKRREKRLKDLIHTEKGVFKKVKRLT